MFKAKSEGICSVCHKKINIGDAYSWDRTGKTKDKWHDACRPKTAPVKAYKKIQGNGHATPALPAPSSPSIVYVPVTIDMDQLRDFEKNMAARIQEINEIIQLFMKRRSGASG